MSGLDIFAFGEHRLDIRTDEHVPVRPTALSRVSISAVQDFAVAFPVLLGKSSSRSVLQFLRPPAVFTPVPLEVGFPRFLLCLLALQRAFDAVFLEIRLLYPSFELVCRLIELNPVLLDVSQFGLALESVRPNITVGSVFFQASPPYLVLGKLKRIGRSVFPCIGFG
jgi:hypothetical protein